MKEDVYVLKAYSITGEVLGCGDYNKVITLISKDNLINTNKNKQAIN